LENELRLKEEIQEIAGIIFEGTKENTYIKMINNDEEFGRAAIKYYLEITAAEKFSDYGNSLKHRMSEYINKRIKKKIMEAK
jgi:coproporphyrinogen III oxidase